MVSKIHQALDKAVPKIRYDAHGRVDSVQLGLIAVDQDPGSILNIFREIISQPHFLRVVRPGAEGMPSKAGDCNDTVKDASVSEQRA